MNIFDQLRSANIVWYTPNPILNLTAAEKAQLAAQANLTVIELRQQASTPNIRNTCPLCGQPQTHLINCKGCGSDAFGYEYAAPYRASTDIDGVTIFEHLRAALGAALADIATDEQITAALDKAYRHGGCMICADCWRVTSTDWHAYTTCPIYLLQETAIGTAHIATIDKIMDGNFDKTAWEQQVRAHWSGQFKALISASRSAILDTVLTDLDQQEKLINQTVYSFITEVDE